MAQVGKADAEGLTLEYKGETYSRDLQLTTLKDNRGRIINLDLGEPTREDPYLIWGIAGLCGKPIEPGDALPKDSYIRTGGKSLLGVGQAILSNAENAVSDTGVLVQNNGKWGLARRLKFQNHLLFADCGTWGGEELATEVVRLDDSRYVVQGDKGNVLISGLVPLIRRDNTRGIGVETQGVRIIIDDIKLLQGLSL